MDTEQKIEEYREEYRHLMGKWLTSYGAEFVDNPKAYMSNRVVEALMTTDAAGKERIILDNEAIEYEPELIDAQFAVIVLKSEHDRMNQAHTVQSFNESI